MNNGFRQADAWVPRFKTTLMGFVFGLWFGGAQALNLTDYDQASPGRATGEIRITDLDYSITQIGVQINVPNSQVNFELKRDGNAIVIVVTDPHPRLSDTLMNVSLVSDDEIINRAYVILGNAAIDATPPLLKQPAIELDYAVINTSDALTPDNALTIDITDSASIRTVRDAVNLIVHGSNVTLLELPGDDAVLDIVIAKDAQINQLEDLYALSNYQVGEVIVDIAQGIVRVRPHHNRQRLYLDQTPAGDEPTEPQAIQQTVRDVVQTLANDKGMTLLELPGDAQRLNTRIPIETPITTFEALYTLPNNPIHQIVLDQANQTIRVL